MITWGLVIFYFLLFFLLIKHLPFFKKSGLKPSFLIAILSLKFLFSLGLYYIYTHHYPIRAEADIFKYFDDSEIVYQSFYNSPADFFKLIFEYHIDTEEFFDTYLQHMNNWDRIYDTNVYNDSRTIIKFNAFFRFISFGKFHIHALFFCFLSLFGTVALYRVAKKFNFKSSAITALLLFLMPSVLLWSSGVLKESILIFALGLLLLSVDKLLHHKKGKLPIITILIMLLLMIYIKFYVLVAFIPAIACYVVAHYVNIQKWKVYLPILLLFGGLAMVSKYIPPYMDFVDILEGKQEDFIRLAEFQNAGSKFYLTDMDQSLWGVVKVIPEGILNCFIRPLPWNVSNTLSIPAIIENLFILSLLIWSILIIIREKVSVNENDRNFIWFSILFVLLLYAIIGVTTPVAGALVRYKVPALPFLMIVLVYFLQNTQLLGRINRQVSRFVIH